MIKFIIFLSVITFFTVLPLPVYAAGATLTLSPSQGTINKSCNYTTDILLDTGGNDTEGADVNLNFDPSVISVTNIVEGSVYPDYAAKSYDNTAGTITISAISAIKKPFNGTGKFATVHFTVSPTAVSQSTQLTFDFNSGNKSDTTDSNVVQTGTVVDILDSVVDGDYTVSSGPCSGSGPSIPAPRSTTIPRGAPSVTATPSAFPISTLPPGGFTAPTLALTLIGSLLTILGIVGIALL